MPIFVNRGDRPVIEQRKNFIEVGRTQVSEKHMTPKNGVSQISHGISQV